MPDIQQELTITKRATQIIQGVIQKYNIPPMLQMFLNPYLEKFLQLSDEDTDERVLHFISEMESYFEYIKTGKISDAN